MPEQLGFRTVLDQIGHTLLRALLDRADMFASVLMDGALIASAIIVRYLTLLAFNQFTPDHAGTIWIEALEKITDIGIISTAALYTFFDLLKRIVRSGKSLMSELRSAPPTGMVQISGASE